jgi:hypothetical protein
MLSGQPRDRRVRPGRIVHRAGPFQLLEPVPARVTVHRVLVRNGQARAQVHPRTYRRWQREAPMHLWQMDLVGGVPLADGHECKMVTGIDDHSWFVPTLIRLVRSSDPVDLVEGCA